MKHLASHFFIFLLLSNTTLTFALDTNPDNTQKKLSDLRKKIKQVQSYLTKIHQTKNSHLLKLKDIVININVVANNILKLSDKINQLNLEYKQLSDNYQQQLNHMHHQRKILAGQVNASYRTGQKEFIKLLLNQEDPLLFSRIMSYYQYFHQARIKNIAKIDSLVQSISHQRNKILLKQQEIALQQHLKEDEKKLLEQSKSQHNQIIKDLSQREHQTEDELQQLQLDEKNLQQLLEKINIAIKELRIIKPKIPFSNLKGKLYWPSKGRLNKLYGRWRSINKVKWQGNIINNQEGSPVYSISHGRVVFSDWFRGYGLLTIIDHGKGFMSLYGHSETLLKAVGDVVDKGDRIATSGRSGGRKQSGIYFEIRNNGKPVNPSKWCVRMVKS